MVLMGLSELDLKAFFQDLSSCHQTHFKGTSRLLIYGAMLSVVWLQAVSSLLTMNIDGVWQELTRIHLG